MRKTIWNMLEVNMEGRLHLAIILLIILNVFAVILSSMPSLDESYAHYFDMFEIFSLCVFGVEYLLRVWACTADSRYGNSWRGRLRYMRTPMAIVDLLALLPAVLFFVEVDTRVIRIFRLLRLLRIGKLAHYNDSIHLIGRVIYAKRGELVSTLMLMFFMLVVASTLMYAAEHGAQPELYSSIPASMWWGIVTLTTVGYGDAYPVTIFGKVLTSFFALIAVGMVALPSGILASGMMEEMEKKKKASQNDVAPICPHCGKEIGAE